MTISKREVKFRAWDESQKYMAQQGMPDLETLQSFMFHFGDKPLMQFTGLKDKNDKEIYDKDIIGDGEMIGCIWWNPDGFWDIQIGEDIKEGLSEMGEYYLGNIARYCRVHGNIYETPKLLNLTKEEAPKWQ